MILKKGVSANSIKPELLLALIVADGVYTKHGQELVVTSLNDGKHSKTSLHYCGFGADLRTRYFKNQAAKANVTKAIRLRLGIDYDVIVEKDHIHIEFQPRRRD